MCEIREYRWRYRSKRNESAGDGEEDGGGDEERW